MNEMIKFFPTHELDEHYQGETPDEPQELQWIDISLLPQRIRDLVRGNYYVIIAPLHNSEGHNE